MGFFCFQDVTPMAEPYPLHEACLSSDLEAVARLLNDEELMRENEEGVSLGSSSLFCRRLITHTWGIKGATHSHRMLFGICRVSTAAVAALSPRASALSGQKKCNLLGHPF